MAIYKDTVVTHEFLDLNPNAYYVYGENIERKGRGDLAKLREHPHALGFITKKFADDEDSSFYRPEEYSPIFFEELNKLASIIEKRPDKIFYISPLGSSSRANKYRIWELLISHNLVRKLEKFKNVVFCWT
jgi:hypothetical protein